MKKLMTLMIGAALAFGAVSGYAAPQKKKTTTVTKSTKTVKKTTKVTK